MMINEKYVKAQQFIVAGCRHCFGPPIGGFPPIFHEFPTPLRSVQIC